MPRKRLASLAGRLRPVRFAGLCAIALLLPACGAGPVTIAGKVVDQRGVPVQRAEIETEPETDIVQTNRKGFFVLRQKLGDLGQTEALTPGVYKIRVKKFGFDDLAIEVKVEGPTKIPDLVLEPRTADIGEETAPEASEERETEADEGSTPKAGI